MFKQGLTSRTNNILLALLLVVPALAFSVSAHAAQVTQRTIALGTSASSAATTHEFRFIMPSSANIGSIEFEYCSNNPFVDTFCAAPPGLDVTGSVIDSQSGETGFTIDPATTVNTLVISRPSAAVAGPVSVNYLFDNAVNPSTTNTTTYVRISTYASTDATGPIIDDGSVVFSTSGNLGVGGFVPPYLTFCVGITVAPRCESVEGNYVNLGELDPGAPKFGTSQFAAATNDVTGYSVVLLGTTMTSGNNIIPGLDSNTSSNPGVSQFGINLVPNTVPAVGGSIDGVGLSGSVSANYSTPNNYRFIPGEAIAESGLPSDFNRYTVSYIANVSEDQAPGAYTTTLQYVAVAQF